MISVQYAHLSTLERTSGNNSSRWNRVHFFLWQPDTETGDIVFVIQEKEHAVFKRKGDDLFMEHTLTLAEALCGFEFLVNHLDGRQLLIKSNPGEIIKPSE